MATLYVCAVPTTLLTSVLTYERQGLPLGSAYRNGMAAHDFAMALAAAVMDDWLPHARSSPGVGLMIDESSTVSGENALITYLKFLRRGVPQVRFWKLVEMQKADAESLFNALQGIFDEDDLDCSKLYSMSTDGASAMLGHESGVATRLKVSTS